MERSRTRRLTDQGAWLADWRHPAAAGDGLGVHYASRTGGTRRGGLDTAPKSTPRDGGTTKSAQTKAAAHVGRSRSGGESGNSPGKRGATTKGQPERMKFRRGPGAVGKEGGRAQAAAGKGGGGAAAKRGK